MLYLIYSECFIQFQNLQKFIIMSAKITFCILDGHDSACGLLVKVENEVAGLQMVCPDHVLELWL